jgi:hypothetical protein
VELMRTRFSEVVEYQELQEVDVEAEEGEPADKEQGPGKRQIGRHLLHSQLYRTKKREEVIEKDVYKAVGWEESVSHYKQQVEGYCSGH